MATSVESGFILALAHAAAMIPRAEALIDPAGQRLIARLWLRVGESHGGHHG
ncbi:MAG: hypothetical protein OEY16_10390 [Alphaproteobacteria bacterium]|nr:hypothetical protein [Alphaproteobacteria bacterium]